MADNTGISKECTQTEPSLLRMCGKPLLLPAVEHFITREKFFAGARIGNFTIEWLGNNFCKHFIDTIETNTPSREIYTWAPTRWTHDPNIVGALGGDVCEKVQTAFAHVFETIKCAPKSQKMLKGICPNEYVSYKRSPLDDVLFAICWDDVSSNGKIGIKAFPISDMVLRIENSHISGG